LLRQLDHVNRPAVVEATGLEKSLRDIKRVALSKMASVST
jgi:hypothetical protein